VKLNVWHQEVTCIYKCKIRSMLLPFRIVKSTSRLVYPSISLCLSVNCKWIIKVYVTYVQSGSRTNVCLPILSVWGCSRTGRLRKTSGLKRNEVGGGWRQIYSSVQFFVISVPQQEPDGQLQV
jgi:hypothetical protein